MVYIICWILLVWHEEQGHLKCNVCYWSLIQTEEFCKVTLNWLEQGGGVNWREKIPEVWDFKCLDKLLNEELCFNLHLEEALVFESENEI